MAALVASMFCLSTGPALAESPEKSAAKVDWQMQTEWKLPESPTDVIYALDQKHVFVLTKENHVLVYDSAGKLQGSIPVPQGVVAMDIAPRGDRLYLVNEEKQTLTTLVIDFIQSINIEGSPFLGKENAPITIVEFSDFQCPYCRLAVPVLNEVLKKNPDTVKLVFKNMPLNSHPYAAIAAAAALAAKEQGKFWEFHDLLFEEKNLDDQAIQKIAAKLKLDLPRLKKDMASEKIRRELEQDLQDAEAADVTGTPAIYINGHPVHNRSLPAMQKQIEDELNKVQTSH
jgi:2-hydroxychromene-2-carboxylate isomerase